MAKPTPRHKKMYADSPKIEKDEGGKPKVTRGEKKSAEANAGTDGDAGADGEASSAEGMPHEVRHAMERREMNNRHENEHAMSKGDKAEMYARHLTDMKAMHKKHEKEMAGEGGHAKSHPEKGDDKGGKKETHQEKPETKKE